MRYQKLSTILYLAMGWSIIIAVKPLYLNMPPWGLFWLLAGGLAYTAGVGFYAADRYMIQLKKKQGFPLGVSFRF